jgi:hypothetical protein
MISFRVRDSSFAAAICASMLERSSQGSTRPVRGKFLDHSRYSEGQKTPRGPNLLRTRAKRELHALGLPRHSEGAFFYYIHKRKTAIV